MGNTEKIEKETVYMILTTLRLNRFMAELLETTGFKDHVRNLPPKLIFEV